MITFSELGNYGRLGNQLFQYAALKASALRNGYTCKVPDFNTKQWHGQKCLLTYFNIKSDTLTKNELLEIKQNIFENPSSYGSYSAILEDLSDYTNINGFFQNMKYFEKFKEEISEELTPKIQILTKEKQKLEKIKSNLKTIVSLHIRRGDNIDGTNPEYLNQYGEGPFDRKCVVGRYITDSIDYFGTNGDVKFLVFTGGSRSGDDRTEIEWARKYFSDNKFIINDTNDALMDFMRISLCEHNIISPASSYSWWAAFINKNPNKLVICPKDYYIDGITKVKDGFYPIEWKQF